MQETRVEEAPEKEKKQEIPLPASNATKRPSALKSTTRIPNISKILHDKPKSQEKDEKTEDREIYGEKEFSEDDLRSAWKEFAESRKQQGKNSEFTVMDQPITIRDTFTVILPLTNAVKLNILDRFRSDLITHLKTKLDNRHISLETELLKEEVSYKPYTNKEKFDYLIQKKPVLRELKDRLGLDPDF